MVERLTGRQQRVLECVSQWLEARGYPPSVREIAGETGIKSTRGVTLNLDALEKKGYLQRDTKARGIRLIPPTPAMKTRLLPLMGAVAAGSPLLASDSVEEMVPIPESLTPEGEEAIVLRVRGESMLGEGIHDGDLVVVRRQPVAENGELVAVMIEGEATVKRFYRESENQIRLEPSNPAYEPIVVSLTESRAMIVGKVVGLMRSYR